MDTRIVPPASRRQHDGLAGRIAQEMLEANSQLNHRAAVARVVRKFRKEVGAALWDPTLLRQRVIDQWGAHKYPPTHLLDEVFAGLARA